ncbi:MAG: hypothetical protein HGA65_15110 [Oscillochloris sp.]|nr:hypothetical protein [Oscillochloris sp.]
MLTHEEIVKAMTRASQAAGFAILHHQHRSDGDPKHDVLRIVRKDRLHLAPPRDATIRLRYPDVLVTEIDIQGLPSEEGSSHCSQVDLTIAYRIPYPAYLGLDSAVIAARGVREYLIEALAVNPPPRWDDAEDADEEDLTSLFDSIFSVSCTVFESGGDQRGVEIRLDHMWVFAQDAPTNEAEIEGESESILELVDHVWSILLPDDHSCDPLAPLSFLFPEDTSAEALTRG